MPIDTTPEQKIFSGPELEAAVTDGIQRAIGRRVGALRLTINGKPSELRGLDEISISVDAVGSLKGPKPGAKRKPRSSKPTSAA